VRWPSAVMSPFGWFLPPSAGAVRPFPFAEVRPVVYPEHGTASLSREETAARTPPAPSAPSSTEPQRTCDNADLICHLATEFGGTREEPDDSS
jgi:hypothetical protein